MAPLSQLDMKQEGRVLVKAARIVLVDDFAPFRRLVSLRLAEDPWLKIIGETGVAAEAVELTLRLRPDVVLLDINLPGGVSGIGAAVNIRNLAPETKIIFLTGQRHPEVVQAALEVGDGYVLKAAMVGDLLPALDAVLNGRRFVSAAVSGIIPPP
jgi:DNA-binding NarL/FixJ family response regulator